MAVIPGFPGLMQKGSTEEKTIGGKPITQAACVHAYGVSATKARRLTLGCKRHTLKTWKHVITGGEGECTAIANNYDQEKGLCQWRASTGIICMSGPGLLGALVSTAKRFHPVPRRTTQQVSEARAMLAAPMTDLENETSD